MNPGFSRRTTVPRAALVAFLVASLAIPAGLAQAAQPRSQEQRESDARRACAAGRVDEGIEILADLYARHSHPNYIYNQGRCYQQNGKGEQAVARFKEYLRVAPDAPPAVREQVEGYIRELEGTRTVEKAPPPPVREPEPLPRAVPPPAPMVTTPNTVTDRLPPAPPPRQSSPALVAGAIVFGVVGGVGLLGGLLAGAKVHSLEKDVEQATPGKFDVDQLASQGRSAHRYETLQWVGYGVAGAGLLGAVICIMANNAGANSRAARGWTIAGLPAADAGLAVAHRF
jgi:hypothetical protein